MRHLLVGVVFLFASLTSPLVGQGHDESHGKTLAGLSSVRVLVGSIFADSDQARQDGMPFDQLQTDVELKLRQAGIAVVTAPSAPAFIVNVMSLKNSAGVYAVTITAEVFQWVSLVRRPAVMVWAPTWSTPIDLGTSPKDLSYVRDVVKDLTDRFINAYLAANPRR